MAGKPSPSQRIDELTILVQKLESQFVQYQISSDLKVQSLQDRHDEYTRVQEELRSKVAELTAKNAVLEERSRTQEKLSDRGWNFGQAAIISVISMIGGALLSLLIKK